MAFLKEFNIFIKGIFYWICSFVGASFFLFVFGLEKVVIFGKALFLPLPSENSFSVQIFSRIRLDLLPDGVELVVTNPLDALIAQVLLSILLGFFLTIPLFLYRLVLYLEPALLPREKKVVLWSLFPFVFLFVSGSMFSYYFLIPATFKILYPYATIIGVVPYFSVNEFIQYIFGLMIGVGIMFLLPLFMIVLSYLRIISAEFWINKWRFALIFFLILCAIITPDGTAISMVILFVPLVGLYFIGCFFARKCSIIT